MNSPALPAREMDIAKELRERDRIPCVKSRAIIIDRGNERFVSPKNRGKMQVVGSSVQWRQVKPDESIIFQNSKGVFSQAIISTNT